MKAKKILGGLLVAVPVLCFLAGLMYVHGPVSVLLGAVAGMLFMTLVAIGFGILLEE